MKTYQTLIENYHIIKNKNNMVKAEINQKEVFEVINDILYLNNMVKHKGFAMIMAYNKNKENKDDFKPITELTSKQKTKLQEEYLLTGRNINSINKELAGLINSYNSNHDNYIKHTQEIVHNLQAKITTLNIEKNKLEDLLKSHLIKQLKNYHYIQPYFMVLYDKLTKDLKNLYINKSHINNNKYYQHSFLNKLKHNLHYNRENNIYNLINFIDFKDKAILKNIHNLGKTLKDIHYTKIKLNTSQQKLKKLIFDKENHNIRVNFHKNTNKHMLVMGCKNENAGNLNCIAKIEKKDINFVNNNLQNNLTESQIYDSNTVINLYLRIPDYFINHKNPEIQQRYQNYINKGIIVGDNGRGKNQKYNRLLIQQIDFHKFQSLIKSKIINFNVDKSYEIPFTFSFTRKIKKNITKNKIKTKYQDRVLQYLYQEKQYYNNLFKKNNKGNYIHPTDELNCSTNIYPTDKLNCLSDNFNNNNFNNNNSIFSPNNKYFLYYLNLTIEEDKVLPILCDQGYIGVDLNENHVSVSEIDNNGKLIQTFDLHYQNILFPKNNNDKNKSYTFQQRFNQNNNINGKIYENINELNHNNHVKNNNKNIKPLTANQRDFVMGNIARIITDLAGKTQKTIVIEDIDFTKKKQSLSITKRLNSVSQNKKNKNYNRMLNTFSYNKFKEYLLSQVSSKGLELIEVNPVYTSLIGKVKYTKKLGLSTHQSASYVIARRGKTYIENKIKFYEDNKDKLQQIKENNEFIDKQNLKIKEENKKNKSNTDYKKKDYLKKEYLNFYCSLEDLLENIEINTTYQFNVKNKNIVIYVKDNDIVIKVDSKLTASIALKHKKNSKLHIWKTIYSKINRIFYP